MLFHSFNLSFHKELFMHGCTAYSHLLFAQKLSVLLQDSNPYNWNQNTKSVTVLYRKYNSPFSEDVRSVKMVFKTTVRIHGKIQS